MFDLSNVETNKGYSPINPGEAVPLVLQKIEVTEEGHLDFYFEGSSAENPGMFKPRYWANKFDPTDDRYNSDVAENLLKQVRQIVEAFVSSEKADNIKGNNWLQFAGSIKNTLTPDTFKDVPVHMKVIYKKGDDEKVDIPYYGDFISTSINPRKLKLRDATDNSGIPYERILPLSEYGVKKPEDNESPFGSHDESTGVADLPFGDSDDEVPAFGD